MTKRCQTLVRCLRLVRDRAWAGEMSGERLRELASRHAVCTRTIRRDLQALREAGYGECGYTEQDIPGDVTQ